MSRNYIFIRLDQDERMYATQPNLDLDVCLYLSFIVGFKIWALGFNDYKYLQLCILGSMLLI